MKRTVSFLFVLLVSVGICTAVPQATLSQQAVPQINSLSSLVVASSILAMPMLQDDEPCCNPNKTELSTYTYHSSLFECCGDPGAKFDYTKEALWAAMEALPEICEANYGCSYVTIARICITYEYDAEQNGCYAVITIYFVCCCCHVTCMDVPSCTVFNSFCAGDNVSSLSDSEEFKCCDFDSRLEATYSAFCNNYDPERAIAICEEQGYCGQSSGDGQLGIHGFQISFSSEDCENCRVTSTMYYSCCCCCVECDN